MKKIVSLIMIAAIVMGVFSSGVVAVDKTETAAPIAPIVLAVTVDSVVLAPIVGFEYKVDDGEWQESNLFMGLEPLTEYVFYQRVAETDTAYASEASIGTTVMTDKPVAEAPPAPTVREYDAEYVYLVYTPGYEYKMDDGKWQKNTSFPANFGEPHRYYQRVAESERNYASESSEALVYELGKLDRPEISVNSILGGISMWDRVSCDFFDGDHWYNKTVEYSDYEFSLDCVEWKNTVSFWGLEPSTEYTLYVRWKPSIVYNDAPPVEVKKFTTLAFSDCEGREECITLVNTSDTSVEVKGKYSKCYYIIVDPEGKPVSDWQYSDDWQSTIVFEGLEADTVYTVYCRYWYNDSVTYTIEYTKSLTVRTLKEGAKYYRDIGKVKITGDAKTVGSTLTVDLSTIEIPEGATVTVQWYRGNEEIPDVSGTEYTTTKDDIAAKIQAVVTVEAADIDFYGRATSETFDMEAYLLGDVNGDMKVNLADASMTLKYIARWDVPGFNKKAANMNGDTSVNLVDVARILKKIAGWK